MQQPQQSVKTVSDLFAPVSGTVRRVNTVLADKPELVVFSKLDLVPEEERERRIRKVSADIGLAVAPGRGEQPVAISAATGEGVRELLERAYALVKGQAVPTEWRR